MYADACKPQGKETKMCTFVHKCKLVYLVQRKNSCLVSFADNLTASGLSLGDLSSSIHLGVYFSKEINVFVLA